ncbi:MAG TPA: DUF302 domain-containing protein [Chitinophagaceae bacterium]|nr:DUF302 domain-containing protein [Chitinophagaceae bacterium]
MISENIINVTHVQVKLRSNYDAFIKNLESNVNELDIKYAKDVATEPKKTEDYLKSLEGKTGLIIFNVQHHGDLLYMTGKPRKARQYVIGNPLVAIQMTVHDIRAALYAPLRIVVYEDLNQQAIVEYDLPSTLCGQFGNEAVFEVAKGLDQKLLNAITLVDKTT